MSFGPKTQREILHSKRVNLKEAYKSDLYLQKLLLDADHSYKRNKPVRINRKKIIKILTIMKKDILFERDPTISRLKNENNTFKDKYRDLKKKNNYVPEPNFNNLKDEYKKIGYKIPNISPEKNNLFKINPLIEQNNTNLINGLRLNFIEKGNINIAFKSMNYLNRLYNITEKLLEKLKKKKKGIMKHDSFTFRNNIVNNVSFNFDKSKDEELLTSIKNLLKLIKIEVEKFNKKHNKSFSSNQLNKIEKIEQKPNFKTTSKIKKFNLKKSEQSIKIEKNSYFKGFSKKNKISNYSINKTSKIKNLIKTLSFDEDDDDNLKLNLKKCNFSQIQKTNKIPKLKTNNLIFETSKKSRNSQNFFNSQKNDTNYTINSSAFNTNSNFYTTFSINKNTIILENINKKFFLENIYNDLNEGEYQNVEKKLIKYLKYLKNLDEETIKALINKYDQKNIIINLKELKEISNKKRLKDKIEKLYINNHEINRIKDSLNKMKENEVTISNFDKNYIKIINKEYL